MPSNKNTGARYFGVRLYSVLLYVMMPLILLYLWWHGRNNLAYRHRMKERFCSQQIDKKWRGAIVFHCVSVGEFIAARPLIDIFVNDESGRPVAITCMTPTASELIQKVYGDRVYHCYIPFDTPRAIKRFYARLQPSALVILETELWPNLVLYGRQQNIPVAVVNGRMSAQSARGYTRMEWLFKPVWGALNYCGAQSQTAAERFLDIGVTEHALEVSGNLKFDISISDNVLADIDSYRELFGDRPIITAGSTHDGEETEILAAFEKVLQVKPKALLIMVPRHQERFAAVAGLIKQRNLRMVQRSSGRPITADTQVLLADTMGELLLWYGVCKVAFVGGSLIERGGHNPLEVIAFAKPLISGRHTFNFSEIYNQLDSRQAVRWVHSADSLADTLIGLLTTIETAERISRDAQRVFAEHSGAGQRIYVRIQQLLSAS
ncbi:3-deoxy-D-manno-octulosonic-acid transferase [Idiomarina sp. A28L]|uniref:lipid IV(A) 3-deoxy-D-manno-octulosonic acid transferase n=1 Tax=Idiomarina sp. A28L TaxID=1036674 RepID=UPI0002138882|nr:lipid IV(A) 3-deoxy-D-manno-octulosonic acid transferase [Idiomarina sp. A28L]EGN75734.1 3-deoxy-D-manno-octulosonic-acid transferase [Idiomarina sp. A28L]